MAVPLGRSKTAASTHVYRRKINGHSLFPHISVLNIYEQGNVGYISILILNAPPSSPAIYVWICLLPLYEDFVTSGPFLSPLQLSMNVIVRVHTLIEDN